MDTNQNPPSERDWTLEEMEEFFKSQDAVTGMFSGSPIKLNSYHPNSSVLNCGDYIADVWPWWMQRGIHVTALTPPESGWPVAFHCPLCRETTFLLSPWACKPSDGDYWRVEMCANETEAFRHNLQMSVGQTPAPVPDANPVLLWPRGYL